MTGLSVGSIFAGCRLEAIAGRGGMGVVYRATQVALERPVALKAVAPDVALEPAFQERFKHEARLAASIDHPNIVPVYEAGEIEGQLYLVMRWVEGVDMRALIDQGPPIEPARAAKLVAQIASALGAAHAKGLLHRDVKPANVLVAAGDEEHAYLTDFGIARLEHATSGLTHTGAVIGTVDYMAPERIEGATGDARSDIYSLGCLLYEMLIGQAPYVRDNDGARLYAHLSAEIPSASDKRPEVPRALSDVAARAMAKRPEDRFQTATEMARATLAAASTTAPVLPPRESADTVRADTSRPRRWRAVLAGGALLAAAVIGIVVLTSGGDDTSSPSPAVQSGGEIPVPGKPDGVATGGGKVWVAGADGGVVSRIETGSGKLVGEPIPVGADPDSVAVGEGAVWVTNNESGSVSRIDPDSGTALAEIHVGGNPEDISLDDDGAPWVAVLDEDGVRRIDPETNKPDPLIKAGSETYGVLVDGETVWAANRGDGTVARIDRQNGQASKIDVGGRPRALAVEGSSLWVLDAYDRLVQLDRESGSSKDEIELTGGPLDISAGEGAVWVTLHDSNELARMDPASGAVTKRPVPRGPIGVATDAGFVWVASRDAGVVTPFTP